MPFSREAIDMVDRFKMYCAMTETEKGKFYVARASFILDADLKKETYCHARALQIFGMTLDNCCFAMYKRRACELFTTEEHAEISDWATRGFERERNFPKDQRRPRTGFMRHILGV